MKTIKQAGGIPRKRQRMDGAGIYLAPLLNLPPWGDYSDAKQVVQLINLLNARGANMVILYGVHDAAGIGVFFAHMHVFL